jgi:hypothetical protein
MLLAHMVVPFGKVDTTLLMSIYDDGLMPYPTPPTTNSSLVVVEQGIEKFPRPSVWRKLLVRAVWTFVASAMVSCIQANISDM